MNSVEIIDLYESHEHDCGMCARPTLHQYCVPWYEGPVSSRHTGEHGYHVVCAACYADWLRRDGRAGEAA